MIVLVQDRFLSEEQATVSVFDRGFLYGDGLFETIAVHEGVPFLWNEHLSRLEAGAKSLRLSVPFTFDELLPKALELLVRNGLRQATLRLSITRGRGPRGYSPRGTAEPTVVIAAYPAPLLTPDMPSPRRLHTATHRLPIRDGLGALKTSNKLLQIMARAEADDAGADDALLLNQEGRIAEASSANLFWFDDRHLRTPPLADGCLDGITRRFVIEVLARELGFEVQETSGTPSDLRHANGAFLTSSVQGIVEIGMVDRSPLPRDPRSTRLRGAYFDAVRAAVEKSR